jgi:hypothetical protein
MHGGNDNMKFTNNRSLDRQLNEVLPKHVQVRMPPCFFYFYFIFLNFRYDKATARDRTDTLQHCMNQMVA